jgi:hypothetical protein
VLVLVLVLLKLPLLLLLLPLSVLPFLPRPVVKAKNWQRWSLTRLSW